MPGRSGAALFEADVALAGVCLMAPAQVAIEARGTALAGGFQPGQRMVLEQGGLTGLDQTAADAPAFMLGQHEGGEQAGGVHVHHGEADDLASVFSHPGAGGGVEGLGDGFRGDTQLGQFFHGQGVFSDGGADVEHGGHVGGAGGADQRGRWGVRYHGVC